MNTNTSTSITGTFETKSFTCGHLRVGATKYVAEGYLELSTLSGDNIPTTTMVHAITVGDVYASGGGNIYTQTEVTDSVMEDLVEQIGSRYHDGLLFAEQSTDSLN